MTKPTDLLEMYVEQLRDLWSANDQMKDVVKEMAEAVNDPSLAGKLRKSSEGIQEHTEMLKQLLEGLDSKGDKEHCKGMEGLVNEARKHSLEPDLAGPVREVAVIAQYQRMCHYGIAGFGTARAFAEAVGETEQAVKLDEALEDIYQSDDYMSELAERSKNARAA